MFIVYEIKNKKTEYVYIGCSKNIVNRWKEHLRDLRLGVHHCTHLQRAWNKYGATSFKFTVIKEYGTEKVMYLEEKKLIEFTEKKYNISPGGTGGNTRQNYTKEEQQALNDKLSIAQKLRYEKPGERNKANCFKNLTEGERAERVAKWSKAKQGKNNNRYKYGKQVLQIDRKTGEVLKVWQDICTVGHTEMYTSEYVSKCCRGVKGYNTHKGCIWKWKE